jgi:hypothetical protein
VLSKFLRVGLVASLLVGSGAHVALLQTCAWAAMAARRLASKPPAQALREVFDGEHPCAICLKVRSNAQPNEKTLAAPSAGQLDLLHVRLVSSVGSTRILWTVEPDQDCAKDALAAVATPPPRSLPA